MRRPWEYNPPLRRVFQQVVKQGDTQNHVETFAKPSKNGLRRSAAWACGLQRFSRQSFCGQPGDPEHGPPPRNSPHAPAERQKNRVCPLNTPEFFKKNSGERCRGKCNEDEKETVIINTNVVKTKRMSKLN